ncbi:hypothetical protein OL229_04280 [Neisseriaceae bacterium JH1-16]|nr:hypothetical protein [Neisseriaceae bacterium JH1-16]
MDNREPTFALLVVYAVFIYFWWLKTYRNNQQVRADHTQLRRPLWRGILLIPLVVSIPIGLLFGRLSRGFIPVTPIHELRIALTFGFETAIYACYPIMLLAIFPVVSLWNKWRPIRLIPLCAWAAFSGPFAMQMIGLATSRESSLPSIGLVFPTGVFFGIVIVLLLSLYCGIPYRATQQKTPSV